MIRTIIIEDQTAIREMIATLVRCEPGLEVVAQLGDGQEAFQRCLEYQPDFIILDVMLPSLNGVEIIKRLNKKLKSTRILVFSGYQNPALVHEVIQAGAHGFVEKSANLAELKQGIHTVSSGGSYFGPQVTELLRMSVMKPHGTRTGNIESLSKREREILQLIAESYSTKEIAEKLSISKKTAENHRSSLMKKLDLHGVASLTRFAIENGLVEPHVQATQ